MQASWLTPGEIFTPFYGRAITNSRRAISDHSASSSPGQ